MGIDKKGDDKGKKRKFEKEQELALNTSADDSKKPINESTEPPAKKANINKSPHTHFSTRSTAAAAAANPASHKDEKRTASAASASASADEKADSDGDHEMADAASSSSDSDKGADSDTDNKKDQPSNKEDSADGAAAMETDDTATEPNLKIFGEGAALIKANLTKQDIIDLQTYRAKYESFGCFIRSKNGKACCAMIGRTSDEFVAAIKGYIQEERELPQDLEFNVFNSYLDAATNTVRKLIEVKGEEAKVNQFIEWINKHRQSFQKRKHTSLIRGAGFEQMSNKIARAKGWDLKKSDSVAEKFWHEKVEHSYKKYLLSKKRGRPDLEEIKELLKLARFRLEKNTGILYSQISIAHENEEKQKAYFGKLRELLQTHPLFKDIEIDFSLPLRVVTTKPSKEDKPKESNSLIVYMRERGTHFPLKRSVATKVSEIIREHAPKWKKQITSNATGKPRGQACVYLEEELKKHNSPNPKEEAISFLERLLTTAGRPGTMDRVLPSMELGNCFCVFAGDNTQRNKALERILKNFDTDNTYKKYYEFDKDNSKHFKSAEGHAFHLVFFKLTDAAKKDQITLEKITEEFIKNKVKWQKPVIIKRKPKNKPTSVNASSASASAAAASGESKAASPADNTSSKAAAEKELLQDQVKTAARKMAKLLVQTKSEHPLEYKSVQVETEPNKYVTIKDPDLLKIYNSVFKKTLTNARNKLIEEAKEAGVNAGKNDANSAAASGETPNAVDPKFADPKKRFGDQIFQDFYYAEYCKSYRASKPAGSSFSVANLLGQFGQFAPSNSASASAQQPAPQPPAQQAQTEPVKDDGPKKMDLS